MQYWGTIGNKMGTYSPIFIPLKALHIFRFFEPIKKNIYEVDKFLFTSLEMLSYNNKLLQILGMNKKEQIWHGVYLFN